MAEESLLKKVKEAKKAYAQSAFLSTLFENVPKYDTIGEVAKKLLDDKTKFSAKLDPVMLETTALFDWEEIEKRNQSSKLKELSRNFGFTLPQYLLEKEIGTYIGASLDTVMYSRLPKAIKDREVIYREVYSDKSEFDTLEFVGFLQENYEEFQDVEEEDILDLIDEGDSFEQAPGKIVFGIAADKDQVTELYADYKRDKNE